LIAGLTCDEPDLLGHVGAGAEVVELELAGGVGGGSGRLAVGRFPILDRQGDAGEPLVGLIVDDVAGQDLRFLRRRNRTRSLLLRSLPLRRKSRRRNSMNSLPLGRRSSLRTAPMTDFL